jgi:alkanesulfonate monooxygenase SsuD/methylene tetrahydromethanopterin reductase-like flavin-dependent oxidoreductase (luciferase family)
MPMQFLLPPGYTSMGSMKRLRAIRRGTTVELPTAKDFVDRGMIILGSPKTVRETLERHQKEIGFNLLITMCQFGTLPADLTKKSMTLFAKEVMPYLRDKVPPARVRPASAAE